MPVLATFETQQSNAAILFRAYRDPSRKQYRSPVTRWDRLISQSCAQFRSWSSQTDALAAGSSAQRSTYSSAWQKDMPFDGRRVVLFTYRSDLKQQLAVPQKATGEGSVSAKIPPRHVKSNKTVLCREGECCPAGLIGHSCGSPGPRFRLLTRDNGRHLSESTGHLKGVNTE